MAKKNKKKFDIPDAIIQPQLNDGYIERLAEILGSSPDESENKKLFVGRAGEFFVAAHLLRRGLNSATLPVDTGVDLLAHREFRPVNLSLQAENELYQFQVKTTTTNEYRASMPVRKVLELWHKAINLVIVFWSEETVPNAIVLPPSLIRMLTSGGLKDPRAPLMTNGDEVSLRIIESGGRYFIRNQNNEVTAMRNRFDRIEPIDVDTGMLPDYVWWSNGKGLLEFDS